MAITAGSRYASYHAYLSLVPTDETRQVVSRPDIPTGLGQGVTRNQTLVLRPPVLTSYVWRLGDRIDSLAYRIYGDSRLYWQLMDLNPSILDPMAITPGTVIVVPDGH